MLIASGKSEQVEIAAFSSRAAQLLRQGNRRRMAHRVQKTQELRAVLCWRGSNRDCGGAGNVAAGIDFVWTERCSGGLEWTERSRRQLIDAVVLIRCYW